MRGFYSVLGRAIPKNEESFQDLILLQALMF